MLCSLVNLAAVLLGLMLVINNCKSIISEKAVQVLVALCSVDLADNHAAVCKVCMQKTIA